MRILFYYPSNKRTISIETLIYELLKRKHELHLLTLCEKGDLHMELEKMGVKTTSHSIHKGNAVIYQFKQLSYLARYCKKNQIDIVFSHLQQANIIAVFAQYFTATKIVIFRHHDYARNKKESIADKIINRLAELIVVPSTGVQQLMLKNEKIDAEKLRVIPYIYNFNDYKKPDPLKLTAFKEKYTCHLLLIMVSRLVPQKRHYLTFTIVNQLIKEGYDIKLLVMDTGSEEEELQAFIKNNHLEDHIFLLGYKTDITDYINVSDVLIHPSVSEASCSAVKEAGLLEKIVIVCRNVGDFNEYIIDHYNGFFTDIEHTDIQLYNTLKEIYVNKARLGMMGKQLSASILEKFSPSQEVMNQYQEPMTS